MTRWTWAIVLILLGCGPADEITVENVEQPAAERSASQPAPASPVQEESGAPRGQAVSACLVQDSERIPDNALRAIGTEPFWGADVAGRCVTYSTPENQQGVRIWTRFVGTSENGHWSGALDGQPFVMITRPEPGCSDGMSDNVYPIAVTLTVRGERRTGCAEPR
ncbi:MAG TPA: hypothetical protein VFU80_01710 [Sphingomicrobium sp.]|nr:hypothetical protein [Sphingomicrobium sp.]